MGIILSMQSPVKTVDEYISSLPENRGQAMSQLRTLILEHLPEGYEEGMQYGMASYYIPLEKYPNTYNSQALCYVAFASQKNYLSLYLMTVYGEKESWFRQEYEKSGKKLDMGKSCLRFKSIDDLNLELIGEVIEMLSPDAYIEMYEKGRRSR